MTAREIAELQVKLWNARYLPDTHVIVYDRDGDFLADVASYAWVTKDDLPIVMLKHEQTGRDIGWYVLDFLYPYVIHEKRYNYRNCVEVELKDIPAGVLTEDSVFVKE